MVLETLNTPRLQKRKQEIKEASEREQKHRFLKNLVLAILDKIDGLNIKKLEEGIDVNNLDEVRAHLRNELTRANKPITEVLKELVKVASIKEKQKNKIEVTNLKDKLEVTNLKDIEIPKDVSVNNLKDLENEIKSLGDIIKESLNVNVEIPEPKVNIEAPVVNVPETVIKPTDLEPLIKQIRKSLKKLETNKKSNPLAVRMTDGQEWIKQARNTNDLLVQVLDGLVQYQSDVQKLKNKNGSTINPATDESLEKGQLDNQSFTSVTSTATQVTKTAGKRFMIVQNTGTKRVYLGGSGVTNSSYAFSLVPTQMMEFNKISDNFNFYVATSSGETSTLGVGEYD